MHTIGGCLAFVVAVTGTALALPAAADMPDLDVLRHARIVPDSELANMRGRFIDAGGVRFFGLQLYTQWQTGDGLMLSTAVSMGVDFSGGRPMNSTVKGYFFRGDATDSDAAPELQTAQDSALVVAPQTAGAGGLESVDGVVQSIQLAGNQNGVRNEIRFDVLPNPSAAEHLMPEGPLGDPVDIVETTASRTPEGAVQTAIVDDGTLGVSIEIPGKGIVLQRIRGADFGQVAQHVRVNGDLNRLAHMMQITFETAAVGPATRANILGALDQIRGLR